MWIVKRMKINNLKLKVLEPLQSGDGLFDSYF